MATDLSPATETVLAAAAAAAPGYAATAPRERATFLVAVADALDSAREQVIAQAMAETGLGEPRLAFEFRRTVQQLRLFAEVVVEGAYLDVRIDEADPGFVIGPRPDLRRVNVPVGPVLMFAASNFPLAFSVAGGDTAAALAAGCPVVVKAHAGHPRLSELVAGLVSGAVAASGLPEGVFGLIQGRSEGVAALQDARIRAASFTGSAAAGQCRAPVAADPVGPLPVFGEVGSVNPALAPPAGVAEDPAALLAGFVASVSGSAGQLCTKPGFLFLPAPVDAADPVAEATAAVPEHRLLTSSISAGYVERCQAALTAPGVRLLREGNTRTDADGFAWAEPMIAEIDLADLLLAGPAVIDEVFGPFSVIVRYTSLDQLPEVLTRLFPGNLTTTVHHAPGEDLGALAGLVEVMSRTSGRVVFNGWPTGVSVTPAMQHGGPAPATTVDATSVGTASIGRFLRGVCYQNAPAELLPASLRDDNPWGIPQRRSAAGLSTHWGELTGNY